MPAACCNCFTATKYPAGLILYVFLFYIAFIYILRLCNTERYNTESVATPQTETKKKIATTQQENAA